MNKPRLKKSLENPSYLPFTREELPLFGCLFLPIGQAEGQGEISEDYV